MKIFKYHCLETVERQNILEWIHYSQFILQILLQHKSNKVFLDRDFFLLIYGENVLLNTDFFFPLTTLVWISALGKLFYKHKTKSLFGTLIVFHRTMQWIVIEFLLRMSALDYYKTKSIMFFRKLYD